MEVGVRQGPVGIPADIGQYTDASWTDPEVARGTFKQVMGREPTRQEMAALIAADLAIIPDNVQASEKLPRAGRRLRAAPEAGEHWCPARHHHRARGAAHVKLGRAQLNKYFAFGGYGSDSGTAWS